jgi:hypothetical protein
MKEERKGFFFQIQKCHCLHAPEDEVGYKERVLPPSLPETISAATKFLLTKSQTEVCRSQKVNLLCGDRCHPKSETSNDNRRV